MNPGELQKQFIEFLEAHPRARKTNSLNMYSTCLGTFYKEVYGQSISRKGFLIVKNTSPSQTKETITLDQFKKLCRRMVRGKHPSAVDVMHINRDEVHDIEVAVMLAIGFQTGMRGSAIRGLKFKDIKKKKAVGEYQVTFFESKQASSRTRIID